MSAFLQVDYSQPISGMSEKLLFGGQMLLIGMAVVFSVLVLLWLSLELFRILCERMKGEDGSFSLANLFAEREAKPEVPEPKPTKPAKVKAPAAPAPSAAAPSDAEIVAVITAAIAASENAPMGSFRVVSFRRV